MKKQAKIDSISHSSAIISNSTQPDNSPKAIDAEYLSNISPSAISPQFVEYSTIDFENVAPFIEEFGPYQEISEIFLHQLFIDEYLIASMIMKGKREL
jgi:hypothetical protein